MDFPEANFPSCETNPCNPSTCRYNPTEWIKRQRQRAGGGRSEIFRTMWKRYTKGSNKSPGETPLWRSWTRRRGCRFAYLDIIQILAPYLYVRTCLLLDVVERNQYGFQQVEDSARLQTGDYEMNGRYNPVFDKKVICFYYYTLNVTCISTKVFCANVHRSSSDEICQQINHLPFQIEENCITRRESLTVFQ